MNKKILIITIILLLLSFLIAVSFFIFYSNKNEVACNSFSVESCPKECVICPPCAKCSSIGCQTEKFCENIGFDRHWYENIKKKFDNYSKGFGPGDYDFSLQHDGVTRFYKVHVPNSYNKNSPTPLVFAFHGRYSNGEQMKEYYNFIEKSEKEGFIVVFPTGASKFGDKFASWNVGGCCSYAYKINSDDIEFVKKILEDVKNKFNVDKSRIYATGMSNGAKFSYRLACEMSDTFAAIAAVAGVKSTGSCSPSRPIPILHIHAIDDDELAPFGGGPGKGGVDYGSVSDTINWWIERNQCADEKIRVFEVEGTYCESYSNCANDSEVKLCVTSDGGHSWPGGQKPRPSADTPSTAIDATEIIWEFFKKHPMD